MLTQLLTEVVSNHPEKTAIVYDNIKISYQYLYSKIRGFSKGLSSINVVKGDCIALLLPNCPEFIIGFYAITFLNGIVLPLNHLLKAEEISYYLNDSNVKAIITDSQRANICRSIISNLGKNIELIVVDKPQVSAKYFYDLILPENKKVNENTFPFEGIALYHYSSNSTGKPKRVCRTQKNLYNEARNFAQSVKVTPSDNILCTVPLHHTHGLGNCLLAATCNGSTLVILEQSIQNGVQMEVPFIFKRPRVLELIEAEKITILPGVPYIFKSLAETPANTHVDLSTIKLCFCAGSFLEKDVFDNFLKRFATPVRQIYCSTEAGSVCINLDENPEKTWDSVGTPLKNVEIKIVDERGKELAVRESGEIVIKSQIFNNSNMLELNQQTFKDGVFFTGDLGKLDEAGRLYITGRKNLIDTAGGNVDPVEVENILITHPKVKKVIVVGIKGVQPGELVKAVIVLKESEQCDKQEIFSYCKERLPELKLPKIVEFRDELPQIYLGTIKQGALV